MKEFIVVLDTKVTGYKESVVMASFFRISDGFMHFYENDQTNTVACFKIENIVYVNRLS